MRKGSAEAHYKEERKEKTINIRVNESEYNEIKRKAELSKVTISAFMISCAMGKRVKGCKANANNEG